MFALKDSSGQYRVVLPDGIRTPERLPGVLTSYNSGREYQWTRVEFPLLASMDDALNAGTEDNARSSTEQYQVGQLQPGERDLVLLVCEEALKALGGAQILDSR